MGVNLRFLRGFPFNEILHCRIWLTLQILLMLCLVFTLCRECLSQTRDIPLLSTLHQSCLVCEVLQYGGSRETSITASNVNGIPFPPFKNKPYFKKSATPCKEHHYYDLRVGHKKHLELRHAIVMSLFSSVFH